jgi:hypothetical protein
MATATHSPAIAPPATAPSAFDATKVAGDVAVSYCIHPSGIWLRPLAVISTPTMPPTTAAGRHRTSPRRCPWTSAATAPTANSRSGGEASRASRSLAERISP